jgi:hypothetical protein
MRTLDDRTRYVVKKIKNAHPLDATQAVADLESLPSAQFRLALGELADWFEEERRKTDDRLVRLDERINRLAETREAIEALRLRRGEEPLP